MDSLDTRELAFRQRVKQVLIAMALQYPSMVVSVDSVRPVTLLAPGGFPGDPGTTKWVATNEGLEGWMIEKEERWYQENIGVIRERVNYLILPIGYDIQANDEIIIQGDSWLVIDCPQALGVQKVRIDRTKSKFPGFVRYEPEYRQMGMRASISWEPTNLVGTSLSSYATIS